LKDYELKKPMSKQYVYQIKGIMEMPNKDIGAIRVAICSTEVLDFVDVPASIFPKELLAYLKYRLAVNNYVDVRKFPDKITNQLRTPLNAYLDNWVLSTHK
jgi:hypothetical protein